jgi:Dullard-like phosphatase family protein
MLEILELNHRNLMIICENILNKISLENQENIWVLKLNEIVKNFKKGDDKYYMNETYTQKIIYNTDKISKKIRNILLNYKTEFSPSIMTLMTKINQKNYEEINDFFREYILRMENIKKPLNNSQFGKSQTFKPRPPYILSPREKPYTLVLGLDETLANFQQINYTQGVLKLRPYLIEFLENVSRYYELILFTSKTQYYAEPIIRAIEQKKKYFDFIFYRENCIYVQNDLVKDLTRIGRPLDSIIIVDNMPQYFKLQKENGIHIKSFWAQEPNDRALYDLIPILINIALEEIDVRDGLIKYRNEIIRKITSNNF